MKKSRMWQAHVQKISDFLDVGKVWWQWHDDGSVEFFDSKDEPETRPCGPSLYPFRSNSIKSVQQHLDNTWVKCTKKPKDLPVYKLIDDKGAVVFNKNDESAEVEQLEEMELVNAAEATTSENG